MDTTSKEIGILVGDVSEVCFRPPMTRLKTSFFQRRRSSGTIPDLFPHLLDDTRRSWRRREVGRTATERRGWWRCCQSQPEDAPHPSWWPDCERRIHLQTRREARKRRAEGSHAFTNADRSSLQPWRRGSRHRRCKASSWPDALHPCQDLTWKPSAGRAGPAATGRPHRRHCGSAPKQNPNRSPVVNWSWKTEQLVKNPWNKKAYWRIPNVPSKRLGVSVDELLLLCELHVVSTSTSWAHVSLTQRTLPAGQCYLTEVEPTGTHNRLLHQERQLPQRHHSQYRFYRNNPDND